MIVDVHTHLAYKKIFSPQFLAGVARTLAGDDSQKNAFLLKVVENTLRDLNGEAHIRQMNEAGIARSVLLIADFGYALGEAALSIEDIHLLHKQVLDLYPERFMVFAGVDPRRGKPGWDLFERCIGTYNFSGLKLYPPCGFELDDPGLYPLYELCAHFGVPVLSHVGPSLASMRTEKAYPGSLRKVARAFPGVKFILGHGGAVLWETNVAVAREYPNVSLEISTFQNQNQSREELESRFRYFFDHIPDQILFGSDWPMFILGATQKQIVDLVRSLRGLSSEETDKLFYRNAQAVLRDGSAPAATQRVTI
jgi:hypothetical protein